jgi:2-haloalkanoic acid dehalogenase type II
MPVMENISAVFFDYMGTLLDWYSSIYEALPKRISEARRSQLAIAWREAFFQDIRARYEAGLPPEDIDAVHARLLDNLAKTSDFAGLSLTAAEKEAAVKAWHSMKPWPDVMDALLQLRKTHEVFVLANGTTRLQLDLTKSSRLEFDMLFSSQLLGLSKPNPAIYRKAMELVGVLPVHSVMVAAHAYDLRAAKNVDMKTVYVRRWTEDTKEDMKQVKADVDVFLGEVSGADGDLSDLVQVLAS